MSIKISNKERRCYIIPTVRTENGFEFIGDGLSNEDVEKMNNSIKNYNYSSCEGEFLYFVKQSENDNTTRILTFNLSKEYSSEDLRISYSKAFKFLKEKKETEVVVIIPKDEDWVVKAIVEGIDLTDYKFDKYLSKKDEHEINFNLNIDKKYNKLVKDTLIVNSNTKFVRNIVNENASVMTPIKFEKLAIEFSKKYKLKIKVLNEKQILLEKLGLLSAVGQGARNPPRLVMVEYNGDKKNSDKIALVGKGVTFDTGGINLKPTGHVENMKCDMGGAGTVFGAFKACVELGIKKNIVLVLSCAENAISSSAFLPGDVITSYSGSTVEIRNTDAEGRLVLGDAISYVQDKYKVTKIIDMATLTGACLVALGPSLIASLGNDEEMIKRLYESGETVNEKSWNLPIYDEHRNLLKSEIADFTNLGGRFGGTISAAAFLEKFVNKGVSWVHLDIAGAAYSSKSENYVPEFGTGRGVRLLVDYLSK